MTEFRSAPARTGRVTVAIPTRNRAAYLRECVDSVRGQTYGNIEILVGDNASTDETPVVMGELAASDPRIQVMRHPENLGMVGNWNTLLRAATGSYFLLLSDDDLLTEDAISRLVAACSQPDVAFAYAPTFVIDGSGRELDVYTDVGPEVESGADFIRGHLRGGRTVCAATMLYRLDHERRELYSVEIGPVCDFLLRLTLARRGKVACVQEPLAYYREHAGNETQQAAEFTESLFRVLAHPSVVAGELSPFTGQIRWYVQASARELVVRAVLRGDAASAQAIIRVMAAHQAPVALVRLAARVLILPPVRLTVKSLRRARARRRVVAATRPALQARSLYGGALWS